jgi:dipeptidyl aminopeptidase/acylaminoacyl peptidase
VRIWSIAGAPLLLLHGTEDGAVPVHLARDLFVGLRHLGRRVALVEYEGEDHWWGSWTPEHQIDYWTRIVAWWEEHL